MTSNVKCKSNISFLVSIFTIVTQLYLMLCRKYVTCNISWHNSFTHSICACKSTCNHFTCIYLHHCSYTYLYFWLASKRGITSFDDFLKLLAVCLELRKSNSSFNRYFPLWCCSFSRNRTICDIKRTIPIGWWQKTRQPFSLESIGTREGKMKPYIKDFHNKQLITTIKFSYRSLKIVTCL